MLGYPHHVYIDSDYRLSGNSASFTAEINLPKDQTFDSVALSQATIPKSYYIVQDGYNTFTLQEGGNSAIITVDPGNYSMTSFKICLAAKLTEGSPNGYTYAITAPIMSSQPSTAKYTFTVTGNSGVQPSFIFPSSSSLYRQMGFDWSSTVTFAADTLISKNVVNFVPFNGMMILSDLIEGRSPDKTHGSAVLQEIFNFNVSDYSNIMFQAFDLDRSAKKLKSGETQTASFTFTDLDGYTLDFNGQPLNFSLIFFKRDNTNILQLKKMQMDMFNERLNNVGNN